MRSVLVRLALSGVLLASVVLGQDRGGAAVRALNGKVLQHLEQASKAAAVDLPSIRALAAADIEQRAAALESLMEADPREAVKSALSPEVTDLLRTLFSDSAANIERYGTWQGVVESAIADDLTSRTSKTTHRLKTNTETLRLHLPSELPIRSGMTLTVTGIQAGGAVAAADGVAYDQIGGPVGAACGNTGAQNVATILVNLPNYTLESTVDQELIKGVLWGNSYSSRQSTPDWSVNDFWQQNSDGQASAPFTGGSVTGPYLLSSNFNTDTAGAAYCDYMGLSQAAINAADGAVNFANFNRVVVVFPYNGACAWSGLSSIGCWTNTSPGDGSFTGSVSWLRSDQLTGRMTGVQLAAHELGHGLGLHHASSREYAGPPRVPLGAVNNQGAITEYGDVFSTMGSWNFGYYASPHAQEILGWLSSTNYQVVTAAGQYQIEAYETRPASGLVKALKIQRDAASGSYLWLEYRTNSGIYDSQLGSQVWSGALIHYEDGSTSTHSHLLDFTPATTSWADPVLAVGQTWADPYTNLYITVNGIVGAKLNVTVGYGVPPCTRANPGVNISPASASVNPSGTATYAVTITNNDAAGCAASTFNLSAAQPTGLTGTISPTALAISPGSFGTATLSEKAGATTGTFQVFASASNSSNTTYTGTGSANLSVVNVCVRSNPTVTMSPATKTVAPSASISYTVSIKNNDTSVCSSSTFGFAVTHPTGFSGTLSKASLSIGAGATSTVTLTEKAGTLAGTFSVLFKATNNGATTYYSTGSAAVTVAPCVVANPTVALSPASKGSNPSGSSAFTVSVTNNNSASCANAAFTMTSVQPSGFTGTYSATSATIASGAVGTVTLTEKAGTAVGTFSFTAKATTSSTYSGTATGSVSVATIANRLASNAATYKPLAAVTLTTTLAGGAPISGATVTFSLTKPGGAVVKSSSVTTNTSGVAAWTYTLTSSDPNGTYTASSAAVSNRVTYNSNTVSLAVAP